jgi:RHS repeat-associated protein
MSIEQINNTSGAVLYLHHDQAGSTRLLTGWTGTVTGKCTYNAYGTPTCEGAATTPLGFNGQYTSSDTGLVYLRNRVYDPATAQFLSVDPLVGRTHAPYNYAGDNPSMRLTRQGLGIGLTSGSRPRAKSRKRSTRSNTTKKRSNPTKTGAGISHPLRTGSKVQSWAFWTPAALARRD